MGMELDVVAKTNKCTALSESRCALRLRYGTGSDLYRRSWTSIPTPFIRAQRLSERTLFKCINIHLNAVYLLYVSGTRGHPQGGVWTLSVPSGKWRMSRKFNTWRTFYNLTSIPFSAGISNTVDVTVQKVWVTILPFPDFLEPTNHVSV
jgi:hypothetical protein